ncbi:toll/interleukin-1 receptor domain-containing protein [Winogradskyella sp. A2]|uniref:toll/interleukin-1 receptor domain-containing protein n=1 Tax=Winogradskyella sp. A2 TaxID=3366944 RepID=UPI00398C6B75
MHDIFISYAKKDKQYAQYIADVLAQEGFDVWWDIEIPAGKTFDSVIEKAIAESKCVIVLWSHNSIGSEWVAVEAAEGKKRNILIPVRIEEVEIPLAFRRRQYVDLVNWNKKSTDPLFRRLIEDIHLITKKNCSPENELIELVNPPNKRRFTKKKSINKSSILKPVIWKYVFIASLIIGIFGSLAEIMGYINVFPKIGTSEKYQLTVFVTDEDGNVVLEHSGELNTSIGNRPMRETIGEDGRTNFGDILPDYLGDTITIGFKSEGWELANSNNVFVFDGNPISLKIKKDSSLGIIKGVVKTRNGQNFIDNAKVMINTDTIILTDVNGIFKVTLPLNMRANKVTDGYKLTISKEGFETKSQYFYPKSSDAEIRLTKTE